MEPMRAGSQIMNPDSRLRTIAGLAGWLLLCFAAGATGAIASADAGFFYGQLVRPAWAPPAWLFGPVWTALYVLMAVSAWLVWRACGFARARTALVLFLVQLVANALWTWIFFAWQQGALAFTEILLLWGLIIATMAAFRRRHPLAAALLLPYLAWVSFATVLTFSTWRLNPGIL
jgi:tryptophan-rich sensory protein